MRRHVLIVDDSPTMRASIRSFLSKKGFEVTEAWDGKNALETLGSLEKERRLPDLIITDINMPEMDGISLIKELKKSGFRFVPILVLTTESERDLIEQGRRAGAAGWILKPFNPEKLFWAIKQVVWVE